MIEQADIPMLLKAVNIVKQMSEDEKLKEIERMRDKALHDEASELGSARRNGINEGISIGRCEGINIGISKGRSEGISIGISKGKLEERKQFIETMKKLGYTEEEITNILMNISD